jgi:hypothetical protein
MKIVQVISGLTKFVAKKGDYGIENDLEIDVVVGVPFDVPSEEMALARIKAHPNLYKKATPEDEAFAIEYKKGQLQKLDELVPQDPTADVFNTKVESVIQNEITDFILNNQPITAEKLLENFKRPQLTEFAKNLEIEFKGNISNADLVELIVDKVNENIGIQRRDNRFSIRR